jgi:hypothetical protein
MAGRFTRLVVIQILLPSCADWLTRAATLRSSGSDYRKHRLRGVGEGARRQHHGATAGCRGICRSCGTKRTQAYRHPYQRDGFACRQYFWRCNRLSQLEGRGEHGDAQSGNRSRSSRITCVVVNPGWVRTDMGGPHANLTSAESVTRLRRLIENLGPTQFGKFFNYDGREYAW